ncbi:MAG: hypothetical protein BWY73_01576 [candidate division TA06 bacterium ADurb.Bin417]|uniref:Uncharacterized protein n=1 Tax=candidate division TA06 bacterium ADurb.Bin417 TaxID=1852828 RepID=A0A1V5M7C1_UNCT6|nr:MAG: hypothetical protein BWY73_01576 [candidate division TA06 bacterium ADurb.Bin417]
MTPLGADHAHGDRALQSEGIADGQHPLSHRLGGGISKGGEGKSAGVDLEQGQVGLGVLAGHPGVEFAAVQQLDLHRGGLRDHVVIGQDVPVGRDQHAASEGLGQVFARRREKVPEEFPEERVLHEVVEGAAGTDPLGGADVGHRRLYRFGHPGDVVSEPGQVGAGRICRRRRAAREGGQELKGQENGKQGGQSGHQDRRQQDR